MPTPSVRPPRGSRAGAAVRRRSADPVRGLPARDQPCEWCGVENGVYADRCAPWGGRCWLCYEAGPCPRDTRLVAARDKYARARVPRGSSPPGALPRPEGFAGTAPASRPPRGSRQCVRAPKRPADEDLALPARDQPCEWCGVENGVYADRCAPWGSRCWLCYEAGPNLRDLRLARARNQLERARVPRRPRGGPLRPCRAPPLSRRVATLEEKLRLLESRLLHPAPDGGVALRLG